MGEKSATARTESPPPGGAGGGAKCLFLREVYLRDLAEGAVGGPAESRIVYTLYSVDRPEEIYLLETPFCKGQLVWVGLPLPGGAGILFPGRAEARAQTTRSHPLSSPIRFAATLVPRRLT